MTKLNQIIAVEKSVKSGSLRDLTDAPEDGRISPRCGFKSRWPLHVRP